MAAFVDVDEIFITLKTLEENLTSPKQAFRRCHSGMTSQHRFLIVFIPKVALKYGFFHASPTVWNSIPDDLRDPELSIGCYRNKLKTFLFSKSNANAN